MAEKANWFFVYIIESPSEIDIYHNRTEGFLLQQAINLHNIPCLTKIAISKSAFEASFQVGLLEAMKMFPNLFPVIHISAHGSADGLQLSNHEIITWDHLRSLLLPVNKAINNFLLLCMSSCEGYAACKMAMRLNETEHPFLSMVGHSGKPTWSDTAVAYTTLYHLIAKGEKVVDAVQAMKIASGNDGFLFTTAEESQRGFVEYYNNTYIPNIQQNFEQELAPNSLEADTKRFKQIT